MRYGPIVDTEHLGRGHIWEGQTTEQAQEGVATDGQAQGHGSSRAPAVPASAMAMCDQPVHEPLRPPRPRSDERGQPLGEDAAGAAAIGAEELPHLEVEHDAPCSPGEIGHRADIATMDPPRRKPADRTVDQGLCRGHLQRQLGGGVVHVPGVEMQLGGRGEPGRQECHV